MQKPGSVHPWLNQLALTQSNDRQGMKEWH